ncbi:MAG: hypothetical protein ACOH1Y_11495 [Propionicimonas sp.]
MPVIAVAKRGEMAVMMKAAARQGWVVTPTRGNHIKWLAPSGAIVFSASTPSDVRAYRNMASDLRKRGLVLP